MSGMRFTVDAALRRATARLASAGIEGARADARVLLGHVLGVPRERLLLDRDTLLDDALMAGYEAMIERRAKREPIAYITGRREFWSLEFEVTRDTLIPRPESETLIEALLDRVPDRAAPLRVLDLGTGSGCLLLALLSELKAAFGVGVDLNPGALAVARRNAARLGLQGRAAFLESSWGEALDAAFDLVLVNPPYVAAGADLPADVAGYEPPGALFAGADGLAAYRALAPDLARLLAQGGMAAIELGAGQGDSAAQLFETAGLRPLERRRDLAGHERCLIATAAKGRKN